MSRPRSIPEDDALELALGVFWEKGYDRTSLADLGKAIGVGPSSIYNSFGSKAELFRRALRRYEQSHASFLAVEVERSKTCGARSPLETVLEHAARLYTEQGLPPGCAILEGGGSSGSDDSEGVAIARSMRVEMNVALRSILESAAEGEELVDSPRLLAKVVLGAMGGMSQAACDGVGRRDLLAIARHVAAGCFASNPADVRSD